MQACVRFPPIDLRARILSKFQTTQQADLCLSLGCMTLCTCYQPEYAPQHGQGVNTHDPYAADGAALPTSRARRVHVKGVPLLLGSRDTEKALKPGRAPMPRPTAFTYASFSVHSRTKWRALSEPSPHPDTSTASQ